MCMLHLSSLICMRMAARTSSCQVMIDDRSWHETQWLSTPVQVCVRLCLIMSRSWAKGKMCLGQGVYIQAHAEYCCCCLLWGLCSTQYIQAFAVYRCCCHAAGFVHYTEVLEGRDGAKALGWPGFHRSNVHVSPLLFDIDMDGVRDVMVVTYDGEVVFFKDNVSQAGVPERPVQPTIERCQPDTAEARVAGTVYRELLSYVTAGSHWELQYACYATPTCRSEPKASNLGHRQISKSSP